ncbi:hypothetical protein CBR_g11170 [Chara braunii]|uniref:Deubiquitinating enzyme MINDY-3/4 conserved domain-containing protein n=1 Tax=Chara braunii TaxID=69332 RepID=A0A388KQ89_CHABU|nr:hypothetical protein CBR_g11170 [Chara braunii]|eukprot:GBG72240.1 hypothetical protein CBR_g11170 [Chara braunii]
MSGCDDQLGPEPKRSKASGTSPKFSAERKPTGEESGSVEGLVWGLARGTDSSRGRNCDLMAAETEEDKQKRLQRELRAAAAERRRSGVPAVSSTCEVDVSPSSEYTTSPASSALTSAPSGAAQGSALSPAAVRETPGNPCVVVDAVSASPERRVAADAAVPYAQSVTSPAKSQGTPGGRGAAEMQRPGAAQGGQNNSGRATSGGRGAGQSGGSGGAGGAGAADLMEGQLSVVAAKKLYRIVFGTQTSPEVLTQWCRQGFNFSTDPETSMGLVQLEGGPCGVLAPIQALVLKYLIFVKEDEEDYDIDWVGAGDSRAHQATAQAGMDVDEQLQFSEVERNRALVRAIGEAVLQAGQGRRAVVAFLRPGLEEADMQVDDASGPGKDILPLKSAEVLHETVRVRYCRSVEELHRFLLDRLSALRSGYGALLVLFSALLSRGLDGVQADRDDPDHPLITPPFGHASQEVVNLLLCGHAVANVFDGSINMGGGICLNGVPSDVQVGFLTLLESLNLCKVGQNLKRPQWPVWVLGSESHYTVLFALSTSVQEESEAEDREARVRRAFDSLDVSGGGGFIGSEVLNQVLQAANVAMPDNMRASLAGGGIIVWQDFWKALCLLPKSKGGFAGTGVGGTTEKRRFTLFHFNGIAKSVNGTPVNVPVAGGREGGASQGGADAAWGAAAVVQKPRLTRLHVVVPPKWTCESAMAEELEAAAASGVGEGGKSGDTDSGGATSKERTGASAEEGEDSLEEKGTAGQAPLVDCIRTRWPRAVCYWVGDPPSIV